MRHHFDLFVLDTDTRQLLKAGAEVRLSPKAYELLARLIEQRPSALSKAELQEYLWPRTFVSEANLPGLIKEIRRALGDDPRRQHFVRTLNRFGYAFKATVRQDNHEPAGSRTGATTFWVISDVPFPLNEGENILGRDQGSTVWFDRPGVSRRHARILVTDDEATLEDLGSRNGTYLRGVRLSAPAVLRDGDEIRLGSALATFRVRRVAGSTEIEALD